MSALLLPPEVCSVWSSGPPRVCGHQHSQIGNEVTLAVSPRRPVGRGAVSRSCQGPRGPRAGALREGGYVCAEGAPRADSSPISLSLVPRLAWVGAGASGHLQSPGGASGALGGKSHCLRGPCCPVTWGGGHGSLPRTFSAREWGVVCVLCGGLLGRLRRGHVRNGFLASSPGPA